MKLLTAIAYATGWLIGQGIKAADWLLQDTGTGRGEVAEAPERLPTKACPLNATPHMCCDPTFTEDEVIADMEKQFPKTNHRRIR